MLHILYWEFHMDKRVGCSFNFIQVLIDDSHGMAWHGMADTCITPHIKIGRTLSSR
jgi:hypothetical protein